MVNSTPFILIQDLLRYFLELMIIDQNLSEFTIMLFILNQFIPVLHSFSEISIRSLLPHMLRCHLQNLRVQLLFLKKSHL